MKQYQTKKILSVPIISSDLQTIPSTIISFLKTKKKHLFFYVNAYCLTLAQKDSTYKKILQEADIVYSGGIGPLLAAKFLGTPLKERTPTPDFIDEIFSEAVKNNWTFYFLGSNNTVLKKTINKLQAKFPKLSIVGSHHGYFTPQEEKLIIAEINKKTPTVVLVGMGSPKQEKWMKKYENVLNVKALWAVGALFQVISGSIPRAPKIMQQLGLEWFYRLLQEPQRLWKRYILGNCLFLYYVIKEKISTKTPLKNQ